jgi:hypothetical protein
LARDKTENEKGFVSKEGIMNMFRYVAPFVSMLFGLSCIMWGVVASSYATSLRVGGAFIGVLFLLLALVYVLVIFPTEREEIAQTDQVS